MTDNHPHGMPEARDLRRAAALITHANPENFSIDGVNAIFAELHDDHRTTQLIMAMSVLAYGIRPDLSTDNGRAGLANLVSRYAEAETEADGDTR